MGFDERDLRRALADRSGAPSPEFRARLSEALIDGRGSGRRRGGGLETVAAAAAVALAVASVAVLLGSRLAPASHPAAVPTVDTGPLPTPTALPAVPPASSVESIQFLTPEAGWAVVGPPIDQFGPAREVLYGTSDGGATWRQQFQPVAGGSPLDQHMSFIDARRGVLFAFGKELRTTDAGQHWMATDPGFTVDLVRSISFTASGEGWVLLAGSPETQCSSQLASVVHTADFGATWSQLPATGLDDRQCKTEISFRDASHGWITTQSPNGVQRVFSTLDGGRSWKAFSLPGAVVSAGVGPRVHLPVMFDARNGVLPAVLEPAGGFGYYRTTDGGQTWGPLVTVALSTGRSGVMWDFFNSSHWWVTAGPLVAWTSNAGATWTSADVSALGVSRFVEFDVVTGQTVWGLGQVDQGGVLLRSDDGGVHWRRIAVG